MASVFGSTLKRREDPRLITGNGQYSEDIQLPRMLYASVLRSPHAHARIVSITRRRRKPWRALLLSIPEKISRERLEQFRRHGYHQTVTFKPLRMRFLP